MSHEDWKSLDEIARINAGLPFPKRFFRAEHNHGKYNDGLYISNQLARLTMAQRARAAEAYDVLYEGDDSRYECNTRLRQFADRCSAANSGRTIKPRRI